VKTDPVNVSIRTRNKTIKRHVHEPDNLSHLDSLSISDSLLLFTLGQSQQLCSRGGWSRPRRAGGSKTRVVTLRSVALEFSRAAGLRAALSRVHRDARRIHSFLLQHRSGSFRPGLRLTGKPL